MKVKLYKIFFIILILLAIIIVALILLKNGRNYKYEKENEEVV